MSDIGTTIDNAVKIKAPTRHRMSRGKIEDWFKEITDQLHPTYSIPTSAENIVANRFYEQGAFKMRHEILEILPFFGLPQDQLEKLMEEINKIGM